MTLKIIGIFQETDGKEFETLSDLDNEIGIVSFNDATNIQLYYDNDGNAYVVSDDEFKETDYTMQGIRECEPGTRNVECFHLHHSTPTEERKVTWGLVELGKEPGKLGFHGTCSECGSKYFSRV